MARKTLELSTCDHLEVKVLAQLTYRKSPSDIEACLNLRQ